MLLVLSEKSDNKEIQATLQKEVEAASGTNCTTQSRTHPLSVVTAGVHLFLSIA